MNKVNHVWRDLLTKILTHGSPTAPRGLGCLEIMANQTVVPMGTPVLTEQARNISHRFMAAEAAWILSGDNRVATIAPYAPSIAKFSDDGELFFGAYGPRIKDQLSQVIDTLLADPDTRQAVLTVWRPNPPKSKDIPCTVAVHWMIRSGVLHCFSTMRSSDAWLGWPYDVFNFSMLSAYMAIALRNAGRIVALGHLHLTAGSQHLYERNLPTARLIADQVVSFGAHVASINMDDFDHKDDLVRHLWDVAQGGNLIARSKFMSEV